MCQKIQYATQREAKEAAVGLSRRSKYSYEVYTCKECGCYHIATTNKHTLPKHVKGRPEKETFRRSHSETIPMDQDRPRLVPMKKERPIINTGKLLTPEQTDFLKQLIQQAG